MRDWEEVEKEIKKLDSTHRGILKCFGEDRRDILSNDGQTITMDVGDKTVQRKSITYNMIKYAFDRLKTGCFFDSLYFRKHYQTEWNKGPCTFSMTGGILVELKLADRHQKGPKRCYYTQGKGLY